MTKSYLSENLSNYFWIKYNIQVTIVFYYLVFKIYKRLHLPSMIITVLKTNILLVSEKKHKIVKCVQQIANNNKKIGVKGITTLNILDGVMQ